MFAIDMFVGADTNSRSAVVIAKPHADNLMSVDNRPLLNRDKVTRIRNRDK